MPSRDEGLRIGQLASLAGTSPRVLRYYERQGLLAPRRLSNGYRVYTADDAETVRRIQFLLRIGLSTRRMAEVLACLEGDPPTLTVRCAEAARILEEMRHELDLGIATLSRSRALLAHLHVDGLRETAG